MSETVALTISSQETVTFFLGSRHAGQHPFKIQRYPILEVDSDRFQSLCD
jgi:hypothetical protein